MRVCFPSGVTTGLPVMRARASHTATCATPRMRWSRFAGWFAMLATARGSTEGRIRNRRVVTALVGPYRSFRHRVERTVDEPERIDLAAENAGDVRVHLGREPGLRVARPVIALQAR